MLLATRALDRQSGAATEAERSQVESLVQVSPEEQKELAELHIHAALTAKFVGGQHDIALIEALMLKLRCNSFNISDAEFKPIGVGLYPTAAMLNHSCAPNCVALFRGKRLELRTICKIQNESELTLAYIDLGIPKPRRIEELRSAFGFVCRCTRCTSPELRHFRCINCRASFAGEDCMRCSACDSDATLKALPAMRQQIEQAKSAELDGDTTRAISLYSDAISSHEKLFDAFDGEILPCCDALLRLMFAQNNFAQARQLSEKTTSAYLRCYPRVWPLVGLQFFLHGKLEWFLQNTKQALAALVQARDVLQITHGSEHPLFAALLELLGDAEREFSYRK
jgi:SET and MYND domain-containing protein